MNRLALFLIFAAACGTQELLTRDMFAGMGVSNDGTNTTVSADFLSVRQLVWVELSDGDSLVASVGSFDQDDAVARTSPRRCKGTPAARRKAAATSPPREATANPAPA
jgi:hypothetical protein